MRRQYSMFPSRMFARRRNENKVQFSSFRAAAAAALIGARAPSVKGGRRHLTNDRSSKRSHAAGSRRQSQQAARPQDGASLRPGHQNKAAAAALPRQDKVLLPNSARPAWSAPSKVAFARRRNSAWPDTCLRFAHISKEELLLLRFVIIACHCNTTPLAPLTSQAWRKQPSSHSWWK